MGYPLEQTLKTDPATNTLESLNFHYATTGFVPTRVFLLKYIYNESRFSKAGRIDFAIKVIASDPSISVRDYACFLVNKEANVNKVLGIPDYIAWWNENKSRYSNTSTNHP
jgi:hypothetical protein